MAPMISTASLTLRRSSAFLFFTIFILLIELIQKQINLYYPLKKRKKISNNSTNLYIHAVWLKEIVERGVMEIGNGNKFFCIYPLVFCCSSLAPAKKSSQVVSWKNIPNQRYFQLFNKWQSTRNTICLVFIFVENLLRKQTACHKWNFFKNVS